MALTTAPAVPLTTAVATTATRYMAEGLGMPRPSWRIATAIVARASAGTATASKRNTARESTPLTAVIVGR